MSCFQEFADNPTHILVCPYRLLWACGRAGERGGAPAREDLEHHEVAPAEELEEEVGLAVPGAGGSLHPDLAAAACPSSLLGAFSARTACTSPCSPRTTTALWPWRPWQGWPWPCPDSSLCATTSSSLRYSPIAPQLQLQHAGRRRRFPQRPSISPGHRMALQQSGTALQQSGTALQQSGIDKSLH